MQVYLRVSVYESLSVYGCACVSEVCVCYVPYVSVCTCTSMFGCVRMRATVLFQGEGGQRQSGRPQTKTAADRLRIRAKTLIFKAQSRDEKRRSSFPVSLIEPFNVILSPILRILILTCWLNLRTKGGPEAEGISLPEGLTR